MVSATVPFYCKIKKSIDFPTYLCNFYPNLMYVFICTRRIVLVLNRYKMRVEGTDVILASHSPYKLSFVFMANVLLGKG